jgi:hypothetical protein
MLSYKSIWIIAYEPCRLDIVVSLRLQSTHRRFSHEYMYDVQYSEYEGCQELSKGGVTLFN